MISTRFVVLGRPYDPFGGRDVPLSIAGGETEPISLGEASKLAEDLARRSPATEYYIAELILHARMDEAGPGKVEILEVS